MALIKKRDVKSHFAARRRARAQSSTPASQPSGLGFSEAGQGGVEAGRSSFVEDFLMEHSSEGTVMATTIRLEISTNGFGPAGKNGMKA